MIFSLYTQHILVKLAAIDTEFNFISAFTPFHSFRTLSLTSNSSYANFIPPYIPYFQPIYSSLYSIFPTYVFLLIFHISNLCIPPYIPYFQPLVEFFPIYVLLKKPTLKLHYH